MKWDKRVTILSAWDGERIEKLGGVLRREFF